MYKSIIHTVDTKEVPGWYLAEVVFINNQGIAKLKYRRGSLTEDVNLGEIKWKCAKGEWEVVSPSCDPHFVVSPSFISSKLIKEGEGYCG